MTQTEIVSRLSRLVDEPTSDVLYSITMQNVLQQIAHQMGENALSLTAADLHLLREEVVNAILEMFDYRDAIDEGIAVFDISRHL